MFENHKDFVGRGNIDIQRLLSINRRRVVPENVLDFVAIGLSSKLIKAPCLYVTKGTQNLKCLAAPIKKCG